MSQNPAPERQIIPLRPKLPGFGRRNQESKKTTGEMFSLPDFDDLRRRRSRHSQTPKANESTPEGKVES
jgi:hypothetical protein